MPSLQLTQVYLEQRQKDALQALAKTNGTKVAEEMRRAVDAYLAGISAEELRLLDEGTRNAQRHIVEMIDDLDAINSRLDAVFKKLERGRDAPRKTRRST